MRPEIQALRGVAVLTVVVYHLWPGVLPGGFIGVDVFFVISGFLITGQIVREVDRTGRLSLAGFWARRARRILPAALVVLAACALATKATVPATQWEGFFGEIAASAAYVENWHLAEAAVDYQALDDAPSPVRHFWSLAVEEQFYVVWPLLVLLALVLVRGRIALVLGAVTAASFAWSLHKTATDPAAAYFVTPARAWEFGAGGLLALLHARAPASARLGRAAPALSLAGLTAVAVAGFAFGAATSFPGLAALLPVLGAAAVIHARVFAFGPLERLGDISYSVYLWHWPLIVLAPELGAPALLAATLAAGWATKVAVEDPCRRLRLAPRWTFVPAAAGTAAVLMLASGGAGALQEQVERDQVAMKRVLAEPPACFGAAVVRRDCAPRRGVVPTPIAAQDAPNAPCGMLAIEGKVVPCAFGTRASRATAHFALVGDSHASHWRAALRPIALRRGWRGTSIARSHCPFAAGDPGTSGADRAGCMAWREQVPRWLARHPEITTVIVAQWEGAPARAGDFVAALKTIPPSVERIVVIRDNPQMLRDGATLACVQDAIEHHRDAARECRRPRAEALPPDPAAEAARRSDRAVVVDLTEFFCDERWCPPVIGGALVYKDANHITSVYAATLAPYLERALDRAVGGGSRAAAPAGSL